MVVGTLKTLSVAAKKSSHLQVTTLQTLRTLIITFFSAAQQLCQSLRWGFTDFLLYWMDRLVNSSLRDVWCSARGLQNIYQVPRVQRFLRQKADFPFSKTFSVNSWSVSKTLHQTQKQCGEQRGFITVNVCRLLRVTFIFLAFCKRTALLLASAEVTVSSISAGIKGGWRHVELISACRGRCMAQNGELRDLRPKMFQHASPVRARKATTQRAQGSILPSGNSALLMRDSPNRPKIICCNHACDTPRHISEKITFICLFWPIIQLVLVAVGLHFCWSVS